MGDLGNCPQASHSQAVTSALREPGEVTVCNTMFTRQRGFLSCLPSRLWGNQELCFQGEQGTESLGGLLEESPNVPGGCLAKWTLEEVKKDVELRLI